LRTSNPTNSENPDRAFHNVPFHELPPPARRALNFPPKSLWRRPLALGPAGQDVGEGAREEEEEEEEREAVFSVCGHLVVRRVALVQVLPWGCMRQAAEK
jgi:hypothetical protein